MKTLTLTPTKVSDEDIHALRRSGWRDEQIFEAAFETSLFALFNRVAETYGLDAPVDELASARAGRTARRRRASPTTPSPNSRAPDSMAHRITQAERFNRAPQAVREGKPRLPAQGPGRMAGVYRGSELFTRSSGSVRRRPVEADRTAAGSGRAR